MRLRDPIFRQMYIHDATSLQHELPDQAVRYSLVDIANVDSRFLVLFPIEHIRSVHEFERGLEDGAHQCRAPDMLLVLVVELEDEAGRYRESRVKLLEKVRLRIFLTWILELFWVLDNQQDNRNRKPQPSK
jgi:hypothetical protein